MIDLGPKGCNGLLGIFPSVIARRTPQAIDPAPTRECARSGPL